MTNEMGSIRIDVQIENPRNPGTRRDVRAVLVDTGAELSCFPAPVLESLGIPRRQMRRFRQADGTILERWTGPVFVYAAGASTTDEVIFGEAADLVLLGSRSLEGLNLRIDPVAKQLSDAGPMPLAGITGPSFWRRASLNTRCHKRHTALIASNGSTRAARRAGT